MLHGLLMGFLVWVIGSAICSLLFSGGSGRAGPYRLRD